MRASRRKGILDNGNSFCKGPKAKSRRPPLELEYFNVAEARVQAGWSHFCAMGESSGLP